MAQRQQTAEAGGQPDFLLPWQHGQSWLTGAAGFHATNDALDFFPPDTPLGGSVKCEGDPDWVYQESSYYVLASASGVVTQAGNAMVLIDHGGGWSSRHYHMTGFVVEEGDFVVAGQRLARPSTLGACSSGPHQHFWVQGPDGQDTSDITLSGIPATQIAPNTWISETSNYEPDGGPTPTPDPTPTPTPDVPTEPTPTDTPSPTPLPVLRGDANCDGAVTAQDATAVLWLLAGTPPVECAPSTADTDCDGEVTSADALAILLSVPGVTTLPLEPCPPATETPAPSDIAATPTPTPAVSGDPRPSRAP
jgi:hypothetical protein